MNKMSIITFVIFLFSPLFGIEEFSFLNKNINTDSMHINKLISSMSKNESEFIKSKNELHKMSESGVSEATFTLAIIYDSYNQNKEAIKYYKLAIKQGYGAKSEFNLGLLFLKIKKSELAITYLDNAAKHGIFKAYEVLAFETNEEKYYLKSIEYNLPYANMNYSNYLKKNGRIKLSKKFAKQSFLLGESYVPLYLYTNDNKEAIKILEIGVKNKDIDSIQELAFLYIKGSIIKRDLPTAKSLLNLIHEDTPFKSFLLGIIEYEYGNYKDSLLLFNSTNYNEDVINKYKASICNKVPSICLNF